MKKSDLLKLIGDGCYGSDIPDDDETIAALQECHEAGLIGTERARLDDFFFLTEAGKEEIPLVS